MQSRRECFAVITSLQCENYRCFRDTKALELAPITLLFGENNSGKSALIQALHLPALTLQSEDPGICLKLLHPDYDYGGFEDVVYQHDTSSSITLSYGSVIPISREEGSDVEPVILRLSYGYMPYRKEIYIARFTLEDSTGKWLDITPRDKYAGTWNVWMRGHEAHSTYLSHNVVRRGLTFQLFYDPFSLYRDLEAEFDEETIKKLFGDLFAVSRIIDAFITSFRRIHLLGPLRLPPNRTYLYSGELAERVGPRGEWAFQNYSALMQRGKKEDLVKVESINQALYRLGFISKFDVQKVGARYYEFWAQHGSSSFRANLADTGFGASQVLPVIVSLYTSPPDSTLLYEQPEIHLHPTAQAELGSVFAAAYSRDKRIVIETHSESLTLRLQTEVAKGTVKPEDTRIYYILPDSSGHKVLSIPLNEKGEFLAKWPKGFFEENYRESLHLSSARRGG
jgi:hypothetical protein